MYNVPFYDKVQPYPIIKILFYLSPLVHRLVSNFSPQTRHCLNRSFTPFGRAGGVFCAYTKGKFIIIELMLDSKCAFYPFCLSMSKLRCTKTQSFKVYVSSFTFSFFWVFFNEFVLIISVNILY